MRWLSARLLSTLSVTDKKRCRPHGASPMDEHPSPTAKATADAEAAAARQARAREGLRRASHLALHST